MPDASRRILVDTFELECGIVGALAKRGVEVVISRLEVGAYDLGSGATVERKTVSDLHLSLQRGRLWRQIGELREAARLPYLLVEGSALDHPSIAPEAIRGACLAVIGQGVPIIRSEGVEDSAMWLDVLARRLSGGQLGRDRPVYAQRLKPSADLVREAMLAAVPGVSVIRARRLLEHFGSVSAVVLAREQDWPEVPGVGPATTASLREAIS